MVSVSFHQCSDQQPAGGHNSHSETWCWCLHKIKLTVNTWNLSSQWGKNIYILLWSWNKLEIDTFIFIFKIPHLHLDPLCFISNYFYCPLILFIHLFILLKMHPTKFSVVYCFRSYNFQWRTMETTMEAQTSRRGEKKRPIF